MGNSLPKKVFRWCEKLIAAHSTWGFGNEIGLWKQETHGYPAIPCWKESVSIFFCRFGMFWDDLAHVERKYHLYLCVILNLCSWHIQNMCIQSFSLRWEQIRTGWICLRGFMCREFMSFPSGRWKLSSNKVWIVGWNQCISKDHRRTWEVLFAYYW